jgi:dihydroorotase
MAMPRVARGEKASLTLFNPRMRWVFNLSDSRSKSKNSPFDNTEFAGRVIGTVSNGKLNLNSSII